MKKYICLLLVFLFIACQGPKPESPKKFEIPDNEIDPEIWGKNYPVEYDLWKKTAEPKPAGLSKYKKGSDLGGVTYDKISEFPFLSVLYSGMAFSIEYNEPRGHYHMLKDVLEIDPSRVGAGGVCLTCKSPYANQLKEQLGVDYFKKPFSEVHSKIPDKHKELGVSCQECHNPKTMQNRITKFTAIEAFKKIGKDPDKFEHQELRSAVCAQCHVTYTIPKDENMKSEYAFFPWDGSKYGDISIENIIKVLKSSPKYKEWTNKTTGYKLAFIRHPEYELYTRNSVHFNANVSCADCHMPYKRVGAFKVSDHNVTSPLKNGMKSCIVCHSEGEEYLRNQVLTIQDRTISTLLKAGYKLAYVAKYIERINELVKSGREIDKNTLAKIQDIYEEALYRLIFINAENSIGFHNPTEAMRILSDSISFASECEKMTVKILQENGVDYNSIKLSLMNHLNNRGKKRLNFKPEEEFKDPYNLLYHFIPEKTEDR